MLCCVVLFFFLFVFISSATVGFVLQTPWNSWHSMTSGFTYDGSQIWFTIFNRLRSFQTLPCDFMQSCYKSYQDDAKFHQLWGLSLPLIYVGALRCSVERMLLLDIQTSSLGFFFSLSTIPKGEIWKPGIHHPRFGFVAHGKGFFLMINYLLLRVTTFKVSTLNLSDLLLITMTTSCCWHSCGFWQWQRQLLELFRSTTGFWGDLEKKCLEFKPM